MHLYLLGSKKVLCMETVKVEVVAIMELVEVVEVLNGGGGGDGGGGGRGEEEFRPEFYA